MNFFFGLTIFTKFFYSLHFLKIFAGLVCHWIDSWLSGFGHSPMINEHLKESLVLMTMLLINYEVFLFEKSPETVFEPGRIVFRVTFLPEQTETVTYIIMIIVFLDNASRSSH
jgi:hypothetical protein